jgi:hypothetical protein
MTKTLNAVKAAGKEVVPTLIAEGAVTNPIQSIIDDVNNEKYHLQDPTTAVQKLTKARDAGISGATSALFMWGVPSATIRGAKYLASLPKPAEFEEVPKGQVVIGPKVPAVSMTGAATRMEGGEAPFTPHPPEEPLEPTATAKAVAVSSEIQEKHANLADINDQINKEPDPEKKAALINDAIKVAAEIHEAHLAAPEAPAEAPKAAPIEPTIETETKPGRHVRDKSGNRGEITNERNGEYEVEWDDGSTGTVKKEDVDRRKSTKVTVKNSIELAPHGEKVAVVKYDNDGHSTTHGTFDTVEEAEVKAKGLAEKHNYAGYKNENDNL